MLNSCVSRITVNFWNLHNADNITFSTAWTVYVNDNGSNIWFLRNNVWNVLMFSDVWRVMQDELLKTDGQQTVYCVICHAIWTFNDIWVWSIISASLIFFKALSGVWLSDIQLRLIINVAVSCMILNEIHT